jgi:hypothetical protein
VDNAVPTAVSNAVPGAVTTALSTQLPNAVNGAVSNALPQAVNNALTPLIPDITANAVSQATTISTQQATAATLAQVSPSIDALEDAQDQIETDITTLENDVEEVKKPMIVYQRERPVNKTYKAVLKINFAGRITGFQYEIAGAGVAFCSPAVNANFAVNSDIFITVSGADAASRDLVASVYVERL